MRPFIPILAVVAILGAACGDDSWVTRPDPADPGALALAAVASTTSAPIELAPGMDAELAALNEARVNWDQAAGASLRYAIDWWCFCDDGRAPLVVTVVDATMVTAIERDGQPVTLIDGRLTFADGVEIDAPTIDWLFGVIDETLASGVAVAVDYEAETGLPVSVDLDTTIDTDPLIRIRYFIDLDRARADLVAAQALWDEQGFTDYRWTYGLLTAEGPVTADVTVSGGVGDDGLSVATLFALIAEAQATPDRSVRATYDQTLGMPLQVTIEQPVDPEGVPFSFTGVLGLEPG